jgi:hypothetical protein
MCLHFGSVRPEMRQSMHLSSEEINPFRWCVFPSKAIIMNHNDSDDGVNPSMVCSSRPQWPMAALFLRSAATTTITIFKLISFCLENLLLRLRGIAPKRNGLRAKP